MVHNKHFFGKGLRFFLIGFTALLLTLKPSFAQVFPVQANITVVPPYSVYLSHYTSSEQEKVLVSILLRDPVITSLDVKFRFTIEGAGIKLYTNPNWNPQPFNLTGGVLVNLPQEIIADYLKPQHLITVGVNPNDFFKGGKLPEGFYQFKVEVIEYRRNIVISNIGRAALWLMLNEPPRIVFPLAGQKLIATNPQMLNFSWTPSGTSSPLSNLTTQYEFTLVEMVDKNIDPNVAITNASNASKFLKVLDQTSLLYGPADMPLTPGKVYAIRVKAFNTDGAEIYKNNGYSQVQTFTFGDACVMPLSLTLKNPKQSQFDIDVMTDPSNTAWQARFRENGSGEGNWSTLKSEPNSNSKTPKGLKPKTEYEVQVRGLCGDITSDYTPSQTITTTEMVDANRVCNNSTSPFVVGQAGPLGSLKVNDVFLAALFPVKVKEITKQGGGKFSGRGFATLPLFNTGLAVTFDDISINSLMQLTAGEVVVVRDKLNMTLFSDTENPTGGGASGGTGGNGGGGSGDNTDYPPIKDTIVIPAVYDSLIVTGNTITYYLPNSTNPVTIDLGGEGSTLLVPADGKMENAKIVYDGAAHPYTPNQGGASTADPVNFTGLFARFKANPQLTHGFDTLNPKYNTIANYYKLLQVAGKQYYLPWKALKEGTPEPVNLFIKQGTDKMPFSNLKVEQTGVGSLTPLTGAGTGLQTYNLRGSYKGAEESVVASFTLDGEEKYAGAIYLATYGEKSFKVYLVPLNGATVDAGAAAQLQQGLNTIYSQAVVKWSVEPLNDMPDVELGENGLDWADKAMHSSYNAEMNSVISAFKTWKPTADRDAYYLFIVPKFSEGSVEGFMPRNRSFGFITKEQIVDRTVAHELGHGVFNLKHTFSDWAITQGTTDNLMDYPSATKPVSECTKLWKPQWDYIHNPELTTGLWDDMEDGASVSCIYTKPAPGTKEGEYKEVQGTSFEDHSSQKCLVDLYYHTGSIDPNKKGWYKPEDYFEIAKYIVKDIAIVRGDLFYATLKEDDIEFSKSNIEHFFNNNEVSTDFFKAINPKYQSWIAEYRLRNGGSGTVYEVPIIYDVVDLLSGTGLVKELPKLFNFNRLIKIFGLKFNKNKIVSETGEVLAEYSDNIIKNIKLVDGEAGFIGEVDEIVDYQIDGIVKTGRLEVVEVGGKKSLRIAKNGGRLDDLLETAAKFDDNVLEVAEVGLKEWKTFQNRVAEQILSKYPNSKIGSQITLDIYIKGRAAPITIIPDNLVQIEVNGIKKYKLIDAKTSIKNDLTQLDDLLSTCTKNQKDVYPYIDDLSSGNISKVEMRGGQAEQAFGISSKTEIQLESGVEFWVNSSNTDFTKYLIRTRIK